MRVSTKHRFIFLNNVKCASTSINSLVTKHCDLTPNAPGISRHMTGRQMVDYATANGIDLDGYFVFTTIRNPWARMVSQWFHSKREEVSIFHRVAIEARDLTDFVESPIVQRTYLERHTYTAFCCDSNQRSLVDLTMRSEDVERLLPHVLRTIGLDAEIARIPHANRSDHGPYREYYNDRTRRAVAELLWDDIEVGRYVF